MTKKQQIISDFLFDMYIQSDSKELDEWLQYLALENGDTLLQQKMRGNVN